MRLFFHTWICGQYIDSSTDIDQIFTSHTAMDVHTQRGGQLVQPFDWPGPHARGFVSGIRHTLRLRENGGIRTMPIQRGSGRGAIPPHPSKHTHARVHTLPDLHARARFANVSGFVPQHLPRQGGRGRAERSSPLRGTPAGRAQPAFAAEQAFIRKVKNCTFSPRVRR